MEVDVRLFAAAAEALGARTCRVQLPEGASAADLLEALAARGGDLLRRCQVAVDQERVPALQRLPESGEIVVLPPVSGGAAALRVGPEPIAAEALLAAIHDPDLGAEVLFLGTVRAHTDGQATVHLEYEAYGPMAERTLDAIAGRAARLWPGCRLAIAHRTGRLEPGEAAVGVAAASAHRGEAFAAARFCIERVKAELPVWKKEWSPDGQTSWVDHP